MEQQNDKEFLRTEPLGKLLLRLAVPTVAAQLINMLYNIVDRIYIGHIPEIGATALTGISFCCAGRIRGCAEGLNLYGEER